MKPMTEYEKKLKKTGSSLRKPTWAKPWSWMSRQFARLRAWLKYIREEDPEYPDAIATLALETHHWPDEIRACARCGYPTAKTSLLCLNCRKEEEEHREEVEEYNAAVKG